MNYSRILAAGLALVVSLGLARTARADLKVVTTVPDLAALASAVGGTKVSVTSLALATQDPHFVDAKPSLILRANKADLLVAVGGGLEAGWLPTLQTAARNGKIRSGGSGFLDCSSHVALQGVARGRINRGMGDIHPGGNPHYLYAPAAAQACARAIADRMAKLDVANAAHYHAGFRRFRAELNAKTKAWQQRLAFARGKNIITYHDSWRYLTAWLGLNVVIHIEPKPGVPPSPRHVLRVIKTGRRAKAKVVLQESFYPSKTGGLIARKVGATLVKLPAGARFRKGETYVRHMEHVVDRLAQALK